MESRPSLQTADPRDRCVFLAGPTAVGKSEVALVLAEQLGGEIVSVDSMQVYRGLDVGTAKPTAGDRARVAHHLLDVASLAEHFDAARFVELASAAVEDILRRDRVPLFCGGTGLYFKAFLFGLRETPQRDPQLRAEVESLPLEVLLEELRRGDPATHARIDRNNPRRVIRAVEVLRLTGKPAAFEKPAWASVCAREQETLLPEPWGARVFLLSRDLHDLRQRADQRVDRMFAEGLVDETRALMGQGLLENRTAMQAIGYRQVVEHLQGTRRLQETVEMVRIKTRQYARRQMTWFRNQMPGRWIPMVVEEPPRAVAERIASLLGTSPRVA